MQSHEGKPIIPMKATQLLTIPFITALASLAMVACEQKTPAEKAGDAVEDTIEKAGDAVEDAGDAVEDALQ